MGIKGNSQRLIAQPKQASEHKAPLLTPKSIEKLIAECCRKKAENGESVIQIYNRAWLLDLLSGEKLKKLELNFS